MTDTGGKHNTGLMPKLTFSSSYLENMEGQLQTTNRITLTYLVKL